MTAFSLLRHSIAMVFRSPFEAFRCSLPMLVAFLAIAMGLWPLNTVLPANPIQWTPTGGPPQLTTNQIIHLALAAILQIAAANWTYVAWHRFVLLNERPDPVLPPFHGKLVWSYFIRSIALAFMLLLMMLIPLVIVIILTVGLGEAMGTIGIAVVTVGGFYGFFRYSPYLTSAALAHPLTMAEARIATQPYSSQLWLVAIIIIVASTAYNTLFAGASWLPAPVTVILDALLLIIGVSVLTTIYGVAVEERTI